MSEAKRLIKNTGIIAIGNSCTKLLQFFLLPLYTAVLTAAEYGAVDFVIVLVTFCIPLSTLLMDESMFRFLIDCRTLEERVRVVSTSLAVVLVGCVLFAVLALGIVSLTGYEYGAWFVFYTFSSTALMVAGALLRGFGKTIDFSVMNFVAGAGTVVLNVVFLVVFDMGVRGMLSATIVAQGFSALSFLVKARVGELVSPSSINRELAVDMARYSVPLIPTKVSWAVMNMSSRLVIMPVLGASASGLFALAYKFPNVMDMVFGFFFQSWKESSARVLAGGEDVAAEFYGAVQEQLHRVMGSIVVLMVAFMRPVFATMVDPSYSEAAMYVPILLLATYFSNMSGFVGGVFTAYRKTGIMGTSTIVSAVLNVVLNILLIPAIGLWGASFSTLISIFAVYIYRLTKVQSLVPLGFIGPSECFCLVMFAVVCALFYVDSFAATTASCVCAILFSLYLNRGLVRKIINMRHSMPRHNSNQ